MLCNLICNNFQRPQAPYCRRLQHLCTCMPWSSAMSIMLYPQVWSIKLITRQGSYNFTAVKMLHMCHFVCYPSMSILIINRDIDKKSRSQLILVQAFMWNMALNSSALIRPSPSLGEIYRCYYFSKKIYRSIFFKSLKIYLSRFSKSFSLLAGGKLLVNFKNSSLINNIISTAGALVVITV